VSDYYILDGHTPVPATLEEWAARFESSNRHVAKDTAPEGVLVSTVFLGLDHRFGDDGPPLLFETMIFGGEHDEDQWRYSTWDEAVAGHAAALSLAATPTPADSTGGEP
jgi:hypothetical protein